MGAALGTSKRRRWSALVGNERPRFSETSGKVGLKNLGNTCFMNAGLQCLCHLEPLVVYFMSGKYRSELQSHGSSSGSRSRGPSKEPSASEAFAELVRSVWQGQQGAFDPRAIRRTFCEVWPWIFEGYGQQDVQEFLGFLLDRMNEELNLVVDKPSVDKEAQREKDHLLVQGKSEEFAAAVEWLRYLQHGKSFLVDLFQGQLRNTTSCRVCGYASRSFQPFMYLDVTVERGMSNVEDAIKKYVEEEFLKGDNQWAGCERCKRKVDATKSVGLWKLPPVLILLLKRFEFNMQTGAIAKVQTFLKCPESIDLSRYVSSPQREGAIYDVVAVANHHGGFGSGHYTADCRVARPAGGSAEADEWCHFDDSRVSVRKTPAAGESVLTKDAYVVFLLRRAQDGEKIRRQTVSRPEAWPHLVSARNSVLLGLLGDKPGKYSPKSGPDRQPMLPEPPRRPRSPRRAQQQQSKESLEGPPKNAASAKEAAPATPAAAPGGAAVAAAAPRPGAAARAGSSVREQLDRKLRDEDWDCKVTSPKVHATSSASSKGSDNSQLVEGLIEAGNGKWSKRKVTVALQSAKGCPHRAMSLLVSS